MIVGWELDRKEVTAVTSDPPPGEPVLVEGELVGQPVVAISREHEVRFRLCTGETRWDARLRRAVALPDVVVHVDLQRVECPPEVLMGSGAARVIGRWREFGMWAPDGRPSQLLREVVADLVESKAQ